MRSDQDRGRPAPWLYLFGTLAWTWAFWGAALLTGQEWLALPTLAPPTAFLVVGLLAGAVEEPGWRGYAQEALHRRMSVLGAGLVIGVFWAAWHLPLFLLPGTYQHGLGLGSEPFWLFNLAILVGSPFYAWLVNAAGRSALSAVLYHGLGNVAVELLSVAGARRLELVAEAAMALIVVVAAWRAMRTSRPSLD